MGVAEDGSTVWLEGEVWGQGAAQEGRERGHGDAGQHAWMCGCTIGVNGVN